MTYAHTVEAVLKHAATWRKLPEDKKRSFFSALGAYKKKAPIRAYDYLALCPVNQLPALRKLWKRVDRENAKDIALRMTLILNTLPKHFLTNHPYEFFWQWAKQYRR